MPKLITTLLAAALLAAAIVIAGFAVGDGLKRLRTAERTITVKGLAEQDVESDYALWTLSFRRAGNEFGGVQRALAEDRERVVAFIKGLGFTAEEIEPRPLQVTDAYAREYAQPNQPLRFSGQGSVVVRTPRVTQVEAGARAVDPLIQAGVQLTAGEGGQVGPRYQLRAFNDVKAPLLAQATRNAREQAQKFAAEAGAELGALKSANQGVIQVSGGDGGGESDEAAARRKRLRVVSTFEYMLK